RDDLVTGVQTCALPILMPPRRSGPRPGMSGRASWKSSMPCLRRPNRCPARVLCWLLDQIAFRGFDLDAARLEVVHALVELFGLARDLEQDPALVPRHVRAADVGHDLELAAELVDHRFLDQGGAEDELQAAARHW